MSAIILYFSRAGENYVSGTIRNLSKGNTEIAAEMIQELTGSDLFPLTPLVPYSFRYSECIEQAKNDQKRNARPELVSYPQNLDAYDTVYLGFPNYWYYAYAHIYIVGKIRFLRKGHKTILYP